MHREVMENQKSPRKIYIYRQLSSCKLMIHSIQQHGICLATCIKDLRNRRMRRDEQMAALSRAILALTFACVTLAWSTGCSRQLAVPGLGTAADGNRQLPFDQVSNGGGNSPTAALTPQEIPAGAEITVQLGSALSSEDSRVGDSFEALLDVPVIIAGMTIVSQGSSVTGRVVATKASSFHDPGYLRVTLASISINGKSIPVQTSSIFAKAGSYERVKRAMTEAVADSGTGPSSNAHGKGDVKFSTGHRLTFRLVQPLLLQD
jgi:hypothetical protein